MSNVIMFISAVVYFQISLLISSYFGEIVNRPYMDEVFHVPQAQEYCLGNYNEWNDKITTLPGLYLVSTSVLRIIALIFKADQLEMCNLFNLRLTNVFLSTFNFMIIFKIFVHLHAKRMETNNHSKLLNVLSAFSISLFPLNYFFQFLYYTDSGSTFFILASYYLLLQKNYQVSAYVAAIAILYRQTNVIWLGFLLSLVLISNMENLLGKSTNNTQSSESSKSIGKQNLDASTLNAIAQNRSKKHSTLVEFVSKTPNEAFGQKDFKIKKLIIKVYREDLTGKKLLYSELGKILDFAMIQPFVFILLTFLFFVFVNKGIVVGDKENHLASFHLVQMFYFFSFSCCFSFSSFLFSPKKLKNFATFFSSNITLIFLVIMPLFIIITNKFSYEHPFLLADNRHFTFYLWSKLFRRHELIKYLLAPIYFASIYLFYRNLTLTGKSIAWLLAFSVCLCAALIPQKLIEFRYFIIPYYIYRLNLNQTSIKEVLVELIFNALVNAATIYIFFNKTFYWPDNSVEVQRFMW